MAPKKTPFEKGQLVTFRPSAKDLQNFPYKTTGYDGLGVYVLYEKIDTWSYPSYDDFSGKSIKVKEGVTGIVINRAGPPLDMYLFSKERPGLDVCVYTVLFCGLEVQVFGVDLV